MSELKQLQLNERPVTGRESRDNINSFFSKHLEAHAAAEGKENVPVNVDSVEEHRPDTVVVEIQGLVEQQRVSNVLTTNFRRHLENIIRGSISAVTRNHSQRPTPQTSPSPQNSGHSSPVPVPRASTTTQETGPTARPIPRPRNLRLNPEDRSRSSSIASSNNSSISNNSFNEAVENVRPPIPQVVERLVPPNYGEYVLSILSLLKAYYSFCTLV